MALGGTQGNASSPAIAAGANGPWVAWTADRATAPRDFTSPNTSAAPGTAFGGSATNAGLSLPGASASNPSIAVIDGAPVVAWTSTTSAGNAIEVATYSATANGGAGGWVGLGNSYSATGISGVGNFDNAQIVATAAGPVVTWRRSVLVAIAGALRHASSTAPAGARLGAGSASGTGDRRLCPALRRIMRSPPTARRLRSRSAPLRLTAPRCRSCSIPAASGRRWPRPTRARRRPATTASARDPSLAYFGGKLYLAWTQHDQTDALSAAHLCRERKRRRLVAGRDRRGQRLRRGAERPGLGASGADRFRLDLEPVVGRDHRHAERSNRKPPPDVVERHRLRPGAAHATLPERASARSPAYRARWL